MSYSDLIEADYAVAFPALAGYDPADTYLATMISAASARIQRYCNRTLTEAEIAALDEDIKVATTYLVIDMIQDDNASGEFAKAALGDFSYERGKNYASRALPEAVRALVDPFVLHQSPVPVRIRRHF